MSDIVFIMKSILLDFLYRDSLTPRSQENAISPTHSSLPVHSQILTPPFINQYEELDKVEESMDRNIGIIHSVKMGSLL